MAEEHSHIIQHVSLPFLTLRQCFFVQSMSQMLILTFPVILAIPSLSCERSADEKLPAASERRKYHNKQKEQ